MNVCYINDTNAQREYLVKEAACCRMIWRGVAETVVLIDDDWALAKEEEFNRVVDEAVNVNNDDNNSKHQPLNSTKLWIPWLPPAPKSDNLHLDRVELIDNRFILEAESIING